MEVALIGKGPGRELAPKMGEGVVTWGVNDIVRHRQCDVCFWMDRHLEEYPEMDAVITASVNKTKTLLYSAKECEDIPTSEVYPIKQIKSFFGTDYFADSCCYTGLSTSSYISSRPKGHQSTDRSSIYGSVPPSRSVYCRYRGLGS